jgi:hypothetical protein
MTDLFSLAHADALDAADPLRGLRDEFLIPKHDGRDQAYFCGNSLGLQPRDARVHVEEVLSKWALEGRRRTLHRQRAVDAVPRTGARAAGSRRRRPAVGSRGDEHADGEPAPDDGQFLPPDARTPRRSSSKPARFHPIVHACARQGISTGSIRKRT